MMKGAIISLGSKSSQWTATAMKKYFDEVDHLNLKKMEVILGISKGLDLLYNGQPIPDYDCVYVKGSFRYAPLLRAITSILSTKRCFLPLEPRAFTLGHDKLLTQLEMQRAGIPMPKTYLTSTTDAAKEILENLNYPIVMKFPQGTQGKGVMFADSYPSATSMLDALVALNQPFLIQEYIETGGVDIRAIVVGDKVVASMKRVAVKGEKRANIHAGGHGEPVELDHHFKKIAIDAARSIGAKICGVDLLESHKGPMVIEINTSPGLQGITGATKIDVADKIAKYLGEESKKLMAQKEEVKATDILKEVGVEKISAEQNLLTDLDFRASRILLPEIANKIAKFKPGKEYSVKVKEGKIIIENI